MMDITANWRERIGRLRTALGPILVSRGADSHALGTESTGPLIAVTSSRLGRDPALHRHICQFLSRSLLDCRQRCGSLLVASGSAIEPWGIRAAELFAVPVVRLSVDTTDRIADVVVSCHGRRRLSRDEVVIALADRVDAVYVRRGGKVHCCLESRISDRRDATTRVAVSSISNCAAAELIAAGAIGWFVARDGPVQSTSQRTIDLHANDDNVCPVHDGWTRTDGQWLIHCTRRRDGSWPGETERQYRDSILLGDEASVARGPLDALLRIVRSGRITAAATASRKRYPVVCFSARPLHELLHRRCFRPQLGRWDYEPYGIAIRMSVAKRIGVQSVIYGDSDERSMLLPQDRFRFHPVGKTYDWREEREWRANKSVDLEAMDPDDIRVFAVESTESRLRLAGCRWQVTFVSAGLANRQGRSCR